MALEDERELVKATKKKNLNIVKDLQKQLQSSKRFLKLFFQGVQYYNVLLFCRRIESLEASIASDKEPPATLPISRASSHSSLDGVVAPPASASATSSLHPPSSSSTTTTRNTSQPLHPHHTHDHPHLGVNSENAIAGPPATISLSDEEVKVEDRWWDSSLRPPFLGWGGGACVSQFFVHQKGTRIAVGYSFIH